MQPAALGEGANQTLGSLLSLQQNWQVRSQKFGVKVQGKAFSRRKVS